MNSYRPVERPLSIVPIIKIRNNLVSQIFIKIFSFGTMERSASSLLSLIMDKVTFAEVIHRPMFPCRWETSTQPQQPGYTPKSDSKMPRHGNKPTHPGVGNRTPTNPGPQSGGTKWAHPRELRHPKIEALMDPVMAKVGNHITIRDILRGGNISINDLPRLPKYQDSSGH